MHPAAAWSSDPAPPTRKSLIQRLGHNWDDPNQQPLDKEQWRRDIDDFARGYRRTIVAVCLVLSRDAERAEELADQFLGDLALNPAFLRKFDPEHRFRCYLHGWLRHKHGALPRELSLEHRRGVPLADCAPALTTPTFLDQLEAVEARAWHQAIAEIALARYSLRQKTTAAGSPPWVISRYYGVPLPGEPRDADVHKHGAELAAELRLSARALHKRLAKYRTALRRHAAAAIEDLANSPAACADELSAFDALLPPPPEPPTDSPA